MNSQYSDEMINAFVDDELDSRDKDSIKKAMESDAELYQRIKAVCDLKKGLQQTYMDISYAQHAATDESAGARFVGWRQGMAAAVLLCVGMILGWYGNAANHQVVSIDRLEGLKLTPVNFQQPNQIILHVSSSDSLSLEKTIHQVEYIIDQYKNNRLPFKIEVIANSGGIDLLRQDVSPYKDKIVSIMNKHDNISFIACSNAIEKLKMQGMDTHMIAHTKTGTTAIEQIVKRLQEGWVYIKV
jgi:hypothetical protein